MMVIVAMSFLPGSPASVAPAVPGRRLIVVEGARHDVSLDDISRRLALGELNNLNLVVKGDVGGSVEALSDALLKLSTR